VPIVSLSDMTLRTLKPGVGQVMYWDKGLKSFGIRVSPGGTMTWTLLVGQERQRIKLGNYPVIGLKDARELARKHLAERTLGQHKKRAITLAAVYELFEEVHLKDKKPTTTYELKRLLKRHFVSKLCRKQLSEIETHHITDITDRLSPGTAWHAFAAIQNLLNWSVARRHITTSPLTGVPSPPKSTSRSRVLSDAEVKSIWEASAKLGTFGTIVRLLLLTGMRRGECAALRTDYISNDTCTLPSELTKNGRVHSFPLGSLAIQTLQSNSATGLYFPARGHPNKPFNGFSKSKAQLDQLSGVTDWTLHDIRRTFATRLAELGVAPHVIERILNHITGSLSPIARVYNRATFMAEMRTAIDTWETHLRQHVIR
jgi:integrase